MKTTIALLLALLLAANAGWTLGAGQTHASAQAPAASEPAAAGPAEQEPTSEPDEEEYAYNIQDDAYALRDISWELSAQQVADLEGGTVDAKGNARIDEGVELYKLPALRLTYLYEDGQMSARSFRMKKDDKYFASLFISLMMRYGMPYFDAKDGKTKIWVLEDVTIELSNTNYVFVIYTRNE